MFEVIYLYVILHDDNSNGERFRTLMPDLETCMEVVNNAKLPAPTTAAGDYEVMSVMFCGTEYLERHYSATWWKDPSKGHSE